MTYTPKQYQLEIEAAINMMDIIERDALVMLSIARQNLSLQYLLPRKLDSFDPIYAAAEWLIENGLAVWLSTLSPSSPAISLTGKGFTFYEDNPERVTLALYEQRTDMQQKEAIVSSLYNGRDNE